MHKRVLTPPTPPSSPLKSPAGARSNERHGTDGWRPDGGWAHGSWSYGWTARIRHGTPSGRIRDGRTPRRNGTPTQRSYGGSQRPSRWIRHGAPSQWRNVRASSDSECTSPSAASSSCQRQRDHAWGRIPGMKCFSLTDGLDHKNSALST